MSILTNYNQTSLFFSNFIENLFLQLKRNLFSEKSTPFSKRLIIVPSQAMENWVLKRLAEDIGIAAGVTVVFLDRAIDELFENTHFSSKLELIFSIEYHIGQIQHRWPELNKYIKGRQIRAFSLAKQLAALFLRYGVYGQTFCALWEKDPKNWQQALWKEVFQKKSYPLQTLPKVKKKQNIDGIHLFAFSHIPSLYFHFFQQLPAVHFYQLSPSQEFWSDLSAEHPHLTYYGRVGREMARLVEESDLITSENYAIAHKQTQLHALQREWLFLQEEEKIEDDSLELHISLTENHEIQNLYETVSNLLEKESLEPQDILVMAPDISRYEPYIRAIFDERLPFQITDLPCVQDQSDSAGFLLLLDLEKRRFSAPALLELFGHPLFQKKMKWSDEDVLQIQKWVKATGIRWGLNGANRDALLKRKQCKQGIGQEGATWQAGIDFLIEELAIPYVPHRIEFNQAELLGEWKQVIDSLVANLDFFHKKWTIRKWVAHFKHLCTTYFSDFDQVFSLLETLQKAGGLFEEQTYSFEIVYALFKEAIGNKNIAMNGNQLQTIRFCSMLPMRAIPAKVICLIGMNHDAFPRKDHLFSLDLLKEKGDYCPSRLEFDRYLFLEVILSVREKLIISYLGSDPYDQTTWPPSSVIAPLLPYISKSITHTFAALPKKEEALPVLFHYHPQKIEIPRCEIELTDFIRAFRSPVRHYLYHHKIYLPQHEIIEEEEAFQISALQRALLRKSALLGQDIKHVKRESGFPLGSFARLAEYQLKEEVSRLPQGVLSTDINLMIGNVHLIGKIEGILSETLCVLEKKTVRSAVRHLPLFLILAMIYPEMDSLLFTRDEKKVSRFFDDPKPYLNRLLEYYFFSKQTLTPLFPDWIDPILKQDHEKLQSIKSYDSALNWIMRGQNLPSFKTVVVSWKEEAENLYKEMVDAWF